MCLVLFAGVAAVALTALRRGCPAGRAPFAVAWVQDRTRMHGLAGFGPPGRAPALSVLCLLRT